MSERIDTQGHGVKRRKDREFFDAQEIFPWISHYSSSSQEICFFHSSSIPSCKFTPISGVWLHLPIFKVHRNCWNCRFPYLINQLKLSENTFLIKKNTFITVVKLIILSLPDNHRASLQAVGFQSNLVHFLRKKGILQTPEKSKEELP